MIKDKGEAIGNQTGIESRQREFEAAATEAGFDARRETEDRERYNNDFLGIKETRGKQ